MPASAPLNISLDGVANDGPIGQGDRILTMEMATGGAGDFDRCLNVESRVNCEFFL